LTRCTIRQHIVLVTHEPDIAEFAHRIVHIRDGQIYSDDLKALPVISGHRNAVGRKTADGILRAMFSSRTEMLPVRLKFAIKRGCDSPPLAIQLGFFFGGLFCAIAVARAGHCHRLRLSGKLLPVQFEVDCSHVAIRR